MKIDIKETNWRYYQFFDNGYGVSIVNIPSEILGDNLELAVLKGNIYAWEICYDSGLTEDVFGHLTEKELLKTIDEVKALPKTKLNMEEE